MVETAPLLVASTVSVSTEDVRPAVCPETPARYVSSPLWERAIASLREHFSDQTYELWLKPIWCSHVDDARMTLVVPNPFIRDWVQNHYLTHILDAIQQETDRLYQILWLIDDRLTWAATEPPAVPAPRETTAPIRTPVTEKHTPPPSLIPRYTLDQFVVGPSNQLAEAACRAVIDKPGGKYNPLFIYGGVGLGKTHLLQAVGHALHQRHPTWKIVYAKTETFLNEYVQLVRSNRIDEFREKYRRHVDVLLLDDVQELAGKERTQDEFFHTFNALFEMGKQIVVTSDRFPHQIGDLEERIRSRFQWGLIADIQPPALETRMAILLRQAEREAICLPEPVAFFLATHVKSNVRELEGALLRLAAVSSLTRQPITVELARETLDQWLVSSPLLPSMATVQGQVATFYRLSTEQLLGSQRTHNIARARQMAMFLCRKLCKASLPAIGGAFQKDHSTVLSACRKIESLLPSDASLRHDLVELERRIG